MFTESLKRHSRSLSGASVSTVIPSSASQYIESMTEDTLTGYSGHADLLQVARNISVSPLFAAQLPRLAAGAEDRYSSIRMMLDDPSIHQTNQDSRYAPLAPSSRWATMQGPYIQLRNFVSLICADIPREDCSVNPKEGNSALGDIIESFEGEAYADCIGKPRLTVLLTDKPLTAESRRSMEKVQSARSDSHLSVVLCTENTEVVDSWTGHSIDRVFVTQPHQAARQAIQRVQGQDFSYTANDWAAEALLGALISGWDLRTRKVTQEDCEAAERLHKLSCVSKGGGGESSLVKRLAKRMSLK